jgi:hypothetical protein
MDKAAMKANVNIEEVPMTTERSPSGAAHGLSRGACGQSGERGTAVIELVLSLFWIVFAMLFLIGLGHTLMNKQQALVAARYSAYYEVGKGRAPTSQQAKSAIGSAETWRVAAGYENDGRDVPSADGSIISSAFSSLMGLISSQGTITYTASTTPTRGLLPRMMTLRASEHYTIANDTWTCEKSGSYLSIVTRSIGIPRLPFSLSCCKTYQRR